MTSNLPTLALDGARPVLVHYTDRSGALMLRPGSLSGLGALARSRSGWWLSPGVDLPVSSAESLIKS
jgi:hypothetical protein